MVFRRPGGIHSGNRQRASRRRPRGEAPSNEDPAALKEEILENKRKYMAAMKAAQDAQGS